MGNPPHLRERPLSSELGERSVNDIMDWVWGTGQEMEVWERPTGLNDPYHYLEPGWNDDYNYLE